MTVATILAEDALALVTATDVLVGTSATVKLLVADWVGWPQTPPLLGGKNCLKPACSMNGLAAAEQK